MKGVVSFHPLDLAVFDELLSPLAAGGKVNPENFLRDASRVRRNGWIARRYAVALDALSVESEAPPADPGSSLWQRLRSNLEKVDFKPAEAARRAVKVFDADLHLEGRPFFIGEASAEKVATAVDAYVAAETEDAADGLAREQLARLDAELAKLVEPADIPDVSSDLSYRNDLLAELKKLYDLGRCAREGRPWSDGGAPPKPGADAVRDEMPWRTVALHARARPFWIAHDVDGLETICRAAGVVAPDCLSPAWRPFAEVCEAYPALRAALGLELTRDRAVGAFVAPAEVGSLVDFLSMHGARIIGAATRAGEGTMATALLRKIKECAVYAQRHGLGYLEASGVLPPERES